MRHEWTAMERYRSHLVEEWPDTPYKKATLAAIRSSLASLWPDARVTTSLPEHGRSSNSSITPRTASVRTDLAA